MKNKKKAPNEFNLLLFIIIAMIINEIISFKLDLELSDSRSLQHVIGLIMFIIWYLIAKIKK